MATNNYFRIRQNEQNLYQDLIAECIAANGFDLIYIPREMMKKDYLFGEDIRSRFSANYRIEAWCENYDGWKGEGEFLSKFGIEFRQGLNLIMSKKKFRQIIGEPHGINAPRAGDLLYIDFMDRIFEIKSAGDDNVGVPLFQLKQAPVYRIVSEMYVYNNDEFDTNESDLDILQNLNLDVVYLFGLSGSSGSFFTGELVTFNGATGIVVGWDSSSKKLEISQFNGTAVTGATMIGQNSGAHYYVNSFTVGNTYISGMGYGDNEDIELEKNIKKIIDFTEKDPFSEGKY
jgi:hypothetical protein